MKRILSLVLAFALLLGLCSFAVAEEETTLGVILTCPNTRRSISLFLATSPRLLMKSSAKPMNA